MASADARGSGRIGSSDGTIAILSSSGLYTTEADALFPLWRERTRAPSSWWRSEGSSHVLSSISPTSLLPEPSSPRNNVLALSSAGTCHLPSGEPVSSSSPILRVRWHPLGASRFATLCSDCSLAFHSASSPGSPPEILLQVLMPQGDTPVDFAFGVSPASGALAILLISSSGQLACINPLLPLAGDVPADDARNALHLFPDSTIHHALSRALPSAKRPGSSAIPVHPHHVDGALPACFQLRERVCPTNTTETSISLPVIESARCSRSLGLVAVACAEGYVMLYACTQPLPARMLSSDDQQVFFNDDNKVTQVTGSAKPSSPVHGGSLIPDQKSSLQLVEVLHVWNPTSAPRKPPGFLLSDDGQGLAVWSSNELHAAVVHWVDALKDDTYAEHDRENVTATSSSQSQDKEEMSACTVCLVTRTSGALDGVSIACDAILWTEQSENSESGLPGACTLADCLRGAYHEGVGPPSLLSPLRYRSERNMVESRSISGFDSDDATLSTDERAEKAARAKLSGKQLDSGEGRREFGNAAAALAHVHQQEAAAADAQARWRLQRLEEEIERQEQDMKSLENTFEQSEKVQERLESRAEQQRSECAEQSQKLGQILQADRPLTSAEKAAEEELEQRERELDVLEEQLDWLRGRIVPEVLRKQQQFHKLRKDVGRRPATSPSEQTKRIRQSLSELQRSVDSLVRRSHALEAP